MNLSLCDYELAVSIENRLNVFFDGCKSDVGKSIRWIARNTSKQDQRDYFKELKFHYSANSPTKVSRYVRLISRILRPRNGFSCIIDTTHLEWRLKSKYGLSSHYNYARLNYYGSNKLQVNTSPTHRVKNCCCCGELFSCKIKSHKNTCSIECSKISRIDKKVGVKNNFVGVNKVENTHYSTRYKACKSRGLPMLFTYLKYLTNQTKSKLMKKNRGGFLWS